MANDTSIDLTLPCPWPLSWTITAATLVDTAANWSNAAPPSSAQRQFYAASVLRVIALLLGLPLNGLALFVFCRCSLRRLWTTLLLETTCLVNAAVLIADGAPELAALIGGPQFDLAQLSDGLCRGLAFLQRLCRACVAVLVICLAEDRISSVCARHCLRQSAAGARNVTRRGLACLLLLLLLLVGFHAPLLAWYRLSPPFCAISPPLRPSALTALILDLLLVLVLPLAFVAAFLLTLALHAAATADCRRQPPPADHWANKLTGAALALYTVLHAPLLGLALADLLGPSPFCPDLPATRILLAATANLYASLTPLLYAACSRFRRELLFTTCCSRYAMTVQPRDSVMVQNRC